jgi:hypothetical protein
MRMDEMYQERMLDPEEIGEAMQEEFDSQKEEPLEEEIEERNTDES